MLNWQIQQIRLELKYTWKLSRNATDFKLNNIISVSNGKAEGKGEVAPNIRYQETPENMLSEFERFVNADACKIQSLQELTELLNSLKLPNALRFGIESAYVHMDCILKQQTLSEYLNIPKCSEVSTSFSLPIMHPDEIATFYHKYKLNRFERLKLKVDAEHAHSLLQSLTAVSHQPLIIDANEGWKDPDALLNFLNDLVHYPIDIIEQPMPAGMIQEYQYVKQHSPLPIFADESVCDMANFEQIASQFDGINMKLMKAGGYLNGINLLQQAKQFQLQTMVGCMIETSLGISSALQLCDAVDFIDLDGFIVIEKEPFAMVTESNGVLKLT